MTSSIKPHLEGPFNAQKSKGFMTLVLSHAFKPLRLVALAATLSLSISMAYADEYSEVSQLVRNGKYAEALNKADVYLVTKPRDPQMRFLKGVIQRDAGKTIDAISTFTRLTEDYPELPEPYNNLAVLYAGQSQFDKARTALEMAIRTNPSYATAHENLGDVYAKLASQAYNKALQLDASNTGVAPKLALIRELFSINGAKTPTGGATQIAAATPSVVAKPPPTLPTPVTVKPATPTTVTTPAEVAPVVVAAPTPRPTATSSGNAAVKDVESSVHAWAKAWAARDMKGYLSSYGKEFDPPGSMSRSAWEKERTQRIVTKSTISVKLTDLRVTVNGNSATAQFRQDYKSGSFSAASRKNLELVKHGERWFITKESTGS
jgi:tetratricopeptide (TPR) repeat protein